MTGGNNGHSVPKAGKPCYNNGMDTGTAEALIGMQRELGKIVASQSETAAVVKEMQIFQREMSGKLDTVVSDVARIKGADESSERMQAAQIGYSSVRVQWVNMVVIAIFMVATSVFTTLATAYLTQK